MPTHDNFELAEASPVTLGEGQFLVKNLWLSVDPYMRGRMNDAKSYAEPYALGEAMTGGAVGVVEQSNNADYPVGAKVLHMGGWREACVFGGGLTPPAGMPPVKLPELGVPDQHWLSILGMPGGTAWFGLLKVAEAKEGETVFVSAAAGAVGSTIVQVAKAKGMKVIGSAGGKEKCDWVRELGADAVIDYKAGPVLPQLTDALKSIGENGIDVYFDNVGGEHLDAAFATAREWARFAICGMIDVYNDFKAQPMQYLPRIIACRISIKGFLYPDFMGQLPEFNADMAALIQSGKVVGRETVHDGIESAVDAFLGLFDGSNMGKMLVKL
ncbi:NADP-dependent oxidoreductase [Sphingorhabdus lutea]|uniref:NADP-dependent oxidoreductase n=1 Tax=Sphingorhabdus lutea TaxID=1913578 RepID=A0A1L3JFD2_9SPHN|nr:NADP-dependent oxidoreductase [Sphingorhabdus lutea]